jgi:hypothetical protein
LPSTIAISPSLRQYSSCANSSNSRSVELILHETTAGRGHPESCPSGRTGFVSGSGVGRAALPCYLLFYNCPLTSLPCQKQTITWFRKAEGEGRAKRDQGGLKTDRLDNKSVNNPIFYSAVHSRKNSINNPPVPVQKNGRIPLLPLRGSSYYIFELLKTYQGGKSEHRPSTTIIPSPPEMEVSFLLLIACTLRPRHQTGDGRISILMTGYESEFRIDPSTMETAKVCIIPGRSLSSILNGRTYLTK